MITLMHAAQLHSAESAGAGGSMLDGVDGDDDRDRQVILGRESVIKGGHSTEVT
jgi:hypothetical protein